MSRMASSNVSNAVTIKLSNNETLIVGAGLIGLLLTPFLVILHEKLSEKFMYDERVNLSYWAKKIIRFFDRKGVIINDKNLENIIEKIRKIANEL
jgi:hypothetical protein